MVDNITVTPGVGKTIGADEVASVLYQRTKVVWGPDGTVNDTDTATGKPLPVQLRSSTGTDLIGTAGAASTAVVTVQGIASGVAQPVSIATAPVLVAGTAIIGKVGIDQTTPGTTNLVALAANQSVNEAQINGVTPLMGNGVTGTGSQRVTIASDNTAFGVNAAGAVAHDAADSGNPLKIGFKATTSLSGLTLVADADRTDGFAGVDGVPITRPHTNLEGITSGVVAITDGSSTSVIAAQAAGVKTYITTVIIANTSVTAVTVDLRDGAAGTVKATFPVPANTSGVVCNLPVPLPFSAATAVCADPSAAASTITVTLIGFKSKV